jgi:putative salt-induced outer membrane protein
LILSPSKAIISSFYEGEDMFLKALLLTLFAIPAYAQYTNQSEVSMVTTGGNSQLKTYNTKTTNKYIWAKNTLDFGGHYTYGESAQSLSARNWDINTKYGTELSDRLSAVLGQITEGNNFQGIKARYNFDIGPKYFFKKDDKTNFFGEIGYRYTIEDRFQPVENVYENKARAYSQYDRKLNETVSCSLWLEYIPNFTDSEDFLMNGEASLTSILNSTFSLKVAYKGMYDDKPAVEGNKNFDYITTTSLVAKF